MPCIRKSPTGPSENLTQPPRGRIGEGLEQISSNRRPHGGTLYSNLCGGPTEAIHGSTSGLRNGANAFCASTRCNANAGSYA